MEEGEQITTRPLQDKYHHGETLKTMKGAQGPTRMPRLGEQKDGENKPFTPVGQEKLPQGCSIP